VSEKICLVHRLGVMEYEAAWRLQDRLATEIAAGQRPATLLLLEHPHTYTFGRRGHIENLLWDEADLRRRGIAVHWVDRGGDVTYHGPGQLVGYPLLPLVASGLTLEASGDSLRLPQADYVGYIRRLEQTLILALARLGVPAFQVEGMTGVWVNRMPGEAAQDASPAKIGAIGVKVDARGVTRHGFALNVNPDMSYWEGIIGCGLVGYPVTCLAEIMQPVPGMDTVAEEVISAFTRTYGFKISLEEIQTP
jgi:lipoate-protein ligase B